MSRHQNSAELFLIRNYLFSYLPELELAFNTGDKSLIESRYDIIKRVLKSSYSPQNIIYIRLLET
jgi:hypothetical protein